VRALKWILITLAGLVALAVAGVFIVTQLVDPDVFKPRIVAAISRATGRPVELAGDLTLGWYPWLALSTGAGALGNPPQFSGPPLLRWREARLGARLLPLLRGEFVLDRIRVDGLDLALRREASGRANWDGLADALGGGGGGSKAPPLQLAGLDLRDARLAFVEEVEGTRLQLDSLDLTAGAWSAGQTTPLPIEAGFTLSVGGQRLLEQVKIRTSLTFGASTLHLSETRLATRVHAAGLATDGVPLALEFAAASLDPGRASYRLPSLRVALGTARLELRELAFEQPEAAPPKAGAAFSLAPTSLRALLLTLGIEPPRTADARALESFAVDGRFALEAGTLTIEPLTLVLDDTRLIGRVSRGGEPAVAQFSLAGNAMNLDRYLEPDDVESAPFKFPGAALGALRARGTLALETATFDDLAFEGLVVRLLFDEQGLRGDPAAAAAPTPATTPGRAP